MKSIRVNDKIFAILFFIFLFLLYFLCFDLFRNNDIEEMLYTISNVILIHFILSCVIFILCAIKPYNISFLFLVFYFIFIFGQVICRYTFHFIDQTSYDFMYNFSEKEIYHAVRLSLYCMIIMQVGILTGSMLRIKKQTKYINDKRNSFLELKIMRYVAIFFLVISAPFALNEFFTDLQLAFIKGYSGVYSSFSIGIGSIGEKITPFFIISLIILMVSYRANLKYAKAVSIFIILYNGIQVLFGARGLPLLNILFTIIVWNSLINKIDKKQWIRYFILIIPVLILISFIRVVRDYAIVEWIENIGVILKDVLENNIILLVLYEMGIAIFPTAASLIVFPNVTNFKFGSTYLYGLYSVLPNVGSSLSIAKTNGDIQMEISKHYGLAFGGSIVGDIYANYGYIIIILFFFIGLFLVYLDKKILTEKNIMIKTLLLIYCIQIIWTIRNNINPIIRYFVWYILPVIILYKILFKKFKRKYDYGKRD